MRADATSSESLFFLLIEPFEQGVSLMTSAIGAFNFVAEPSQSRALQSNGQCNSILWNSPR